VKAVNKMSKSGLLLDEETGGVNQILPHKHQFAWDLFLKGVANSWSPSEINMSQDVDQWKSGALTDDEKLLVKRCLGFFAGSESLVGNNLLLNVAKWITDAECGQYIMRQAYEESLHNWTVVTCCDSFNLKISEVFEAYKNIESIKSKDDFLMEISSNINRQDFSTKTAEGKKEFLRNLITYYIVCEGTFFFSGFAMLLALGRQNKLPGLSDQIRYTLRDESLHIQFGTYLINTIRDQYPTIWTKKFEEETVDHIKKAVELEVQYAHDVLPRGILGLNADMFVDYMQYIGNRRLEGIGIAFRFESDNNPFPWLSEVVDTGAMTNFFERKVKDYQNSGVLEDDF
jgi:ribonucleoside-diphosphate reductase beta chain|tara:strand:+ start:2588 stop:3616 length:1029 start_codon:yes stop_codon:yes gene_type:complete